MRPSISIRSIGWGIRYGMWLGSKREQERVIDIIEDYGSEDFTAELIALIKGEQK